MNVDSNTINTIVNYLSQAGANRISLFGSFARGDQTVDSDLDLLTENSVNPNLLPFIKKDEKVLYVQ